MGVGSNPAENSAFSETDLIFYLENPDETYFEFFKNCIYKFSCITIIVHLKKITDVSRVDAITEVKLKKGPTGI